MHVDMYNKMAPTIFRAKNARIVIYPRDHWPPHVHVIAPGAEAKFRIYDLECLSSRGFDEQTLREIREYLEDKKDILMEEWDDWQD